MGGSWDPFGRGLGRSGASFGRSGAIGRPPKKHHLNRVTIRCAKNCDLEAPGLDFRPFLWFWEDLGFVFFVFLGGGRR